MQTHQDSCFLLLVFAGDHDNPFLVDMDAFSNHRHSECYSGYIYKSQVQINFVLRTIQQKL
jgi:hypothetical protein